MRRPCAIASALAIAFVASAVPAVASADDAADRGPVALDCDADDDGCDAGQRPGVFVDAGGVRRPFVPTYEAWISSRREPNYARATLEALGLLGLGTAFYWATASASKEDWDDPGLAQKLGFGAVSLDSNLNVTNHLLHPVAGALVYGLARVNGLPVPAALAYSVSSSLLWEFGFEWREQASINDIVYTTMGGLSLGEFMVQLGDYLNSTPLHGAGIGRRIAAVVLGAPRAVHASLDGEKLPEPLPVDNLGLSSAYGHAFRVAFTTGPVTNDRGDHGALYGMAVDGEIVAMPGFLREGVFDHEFGEGNFTELHFRWLYGPGGKEVDLRADAVLVGLYGQRFESNVAGSAAMVGIGSAWRFQESELLGRRDQLSTVHLVGPHAGVWLVKGPTRLRLAADAHVDFASIRSLAFEQWGPRYGDEGLKTILTMQGYTYQLGGSARVRAVMDVGPVSLSGAIEYGHYGSIEGADRHQTSVTRDVHDSESILETSAAARAAVSIVEVGVGIGQRRRGSTMGDVSVDRVDSTVQVTAGLAF